MRGRRSITLTAASLLILASCGGDDDATPAAEPAEAAEAADDGVEPAEGTEPADDGDEPASEPAASGGDDIARITIDGTIYEIDVGQGPAPRCDPDFFAAFWFSGGDQNGFVNGLLPPEGDPNHSDPPNISVNVGELEWIADPSKSMSGVEPGESQVDSFTVDGNSVSGTATFVELNETYAHSGGGAEPTPVTGTFEVSCSG